MVKVNIIRPIITVTIYCSWELAVAQPPRDPLVRSLQVNQNKTVAFRENNFSNWTPYTEVMNRQQGGWIGKVINIILQCH